VDEADEQGKALAGRLHWQWDADRALSPISGPNDPCPRDGRWIAANWNIGETGLNRYTVYPQYTRRFNAGQMMPEVRVGSYSRLTWYWLGV
jgi:hypothetical protein